MSRRKFDNSSDESDIQYYRRKRPRPICYTSDENMSGQEFKAEWHVIQTTQTEKEVTEEVRGLDAELLIENINCNDPMEIYKLFVTDSIIQFMVQQTNKYAMQNSTAKKTKKHQSSWIPVSIGKMKAFLGVLLIMGVVQMPNIRLYWSKNSIA
nr:PREDICTED: uncharacterized protein LOC105663974 [Megachile rotundata]